jgi:CheY-like chemotaxis protein
MTVPSNGVPLGADQYNGDPPITHYAAHQVACQAGAGGRQVTPCVAHRSQTIFQTGCDRKLAEETREKARHDLERRIGEGTAALSNTVIRERLGLLGGRLEVESAPGRGSRLTLVAPLQPLAASHATTDEPLPTVAAAGGHDAAGALFSTGRRTRVLLADDHAVMRQGLAALLQEEPDIEIVGQASDGRMAVELARQLRPDVIVMDVTMPRMGGVEATRLVHDEIPAIRIIGLSLHDEADMGNAMRQAGAVTYLNKGGPVEPLIAAIRGCVPVN